MAAVLRITGPSDIEQSDPIETSQAGSDADMGVLKANFEEEFAVVSAELGKSPDEVKSIYTRLKVALQKVLGGTAAAI